MTITRRILTGLFSALVFAPAAIAQPKATPLPLVTQIEARKVVRAADGRESFAPADTARPGDVIEYVATYRNNGKQPISALEATLPIPANTEFVAGSARPVNARASLDGRAFAELPLKHSVKRDGGEVVEEAPLRDYRQLRWYPGVLVGEQALVFSARVRVIER